MTGASSRTTVVLDLGGVLIHWDPRRPYRQLLSEADVDAFFTEVGFLAWNHEQDAGRTWAAAVAAHAELFPHRRRLLAAYPDRFAETLVGEIPGSVAVLRDLRAAGHRLLALTNWSAELFGHATDRFRWLADFEDVVVSGRERIAKPDPAIFRLLLARYRLDPLRTVYVDDVPANVTAARRVGLVAMRFTDAARLRADLTALRLLPRGGQQATCDLTRALPDNQ